MITAFLNDQLDEDIYMAQPDGFNIVAKSDYACKLKWSLYNLKQSPACGTKQLMTLC